MYVPRRRGEKSMPNCIGKELTAAILRGFTEGRLRMRVDHQAGLRKSRRLRMSVSNNRNIIVKTSISQKQNERSNWRLSFL
jgi:hypothetical protein